MAIAKKTFHSPYITHYDENNDTDTVEGIIDLIKVTGTDAANSTEADRSQAVFNAWGPGIVNETYELLAGEVLEGPFTKITFTAISTGDHCDVTVYERSKIITS